MFALAMSPPLLSGGWDAMSIFGSALFGSATLRWLAIYVAKRRRERAG